MLRRSLDPIGSRERRPMTQLGMTHLCFRVDHVEDLAALAEAAGDAAHRATLSVQPGAGVDGADVATMYLTDPDGVRVEVMAGTPDLRTLLSRRR